MGQNDFGLSRQSMGGNLGQLSKVGVMEFSQLVRWRRTVHNYESQGDVPEAVVLESLELSLWAPNHKLTFPWVYTLIPRTSPARRALAELNVQLKVEKDGAPLSEVKAQAVRANVLNPTYLVSLGFKKSTSASQNHEDVLTLACSVQIACLNLQARGFASKWSTGAWTMDARVYDILGLDAGEVQLEGALMVGLPSGAVPAAPPRPPLSQFLRRV